jgi:probable rRNA maturation factor
LPRRNLRSFAGQLADSVGRGQAFECLIAGDHELRRLNMQFLGKNEPTDVLSFPAAGPPGYLGEIAISWQRAAHQAREYRHSVEEEIRVLMLHGILHLLGYDHQNDSGRMRRVENIWRRKLGLASGLIGRRAA